MDTSKKNGNVQRSYMKLIGGGKFSKVYLSDDRNNGNRYVKKVIHPYSPYERKILDWNSMMNEKGKILDYVNKLEEMNIKVADVYSIDLKYDSIIIMQKYIEGIPLDNWVKQSLFKKSGKSITMPIKKIIEWVANLEEKQSRFRIDINLPNYIVNQHIDDNMDSIYLVDIIPILDDCKKFIPECFYEECLYQIKYCIPASICMLIGYTVYNLIFDCNIDDCKIRSYMEEIFGEIMEYIKELKVLKYEYLEHWSSTLFPVVEKKNVIPAARLWAINSFIKKRISLEKLRFIFSSTSIFSMRNYKADQQEEMIDNLLYYMKAEFIK